MESFVRMYKQSHKYWNSWGPSNKVVWPNKPIPTPWDPEWNDYVNAKRVTKIQLEAKIMILTEECSYNLGNLMVSTTF